MMISFPPRDKMIKYSPFQKRVLSPRPLASACMPPPHVGAKRVLIENSKDEK
jgi:hypothetical protein